MIGKLLITLAVLGTFVDAQRTTCTFQIVGTSYTCRLENQVIRNENDMEEVGGVHRQNFENSDVRRLDHEGSTISVFPSLVIDNFVNLFSVLLNGVEMRTLTRFITNCQRISRIELNNNQIEVIPGGIFRNCGGLDFLHIHNNQIRTINENAFVGLSRLGFLWLSNNNLASISRSIFQNTPNMRTLNLDGNELTQINTETFVDLPELITLDLRNNRISWWSVDMLRENPKIERLSLAGNQITTLNVNTFSNLPNLQSLSIGGLETIPAFENVPRITTFEINNSPMTRISAPSFAHMTSLNGLFVSNSRLESVDFSMTNPRILESLRSLQLNNNSISNLEDSSFEMLSGLTTLGLARNQIERLTIETLQPLLPLTSLNIERNQITRIDRQIIEQSPNIRVFAFGNQCFSGDFVADQNFDMSRLNRCFNSGMNAKVNGVLLVIAAFVVFVGKF
jgi:Leucine-rich repeat (LRR) protein